MRKILILISIFFLVSCQIKEQEIKEKDIKKIKIGYIKTEGVLPFLVARDQKIVETLELIEYSETAEINEALISGKLDGALIDLVTLMKDSKGQYKSVLQVRQNYYFIANENSEIKSVPDIENRTVGILDFNKDSFLLDTFANKYSIGHNYSSTKYNNEKLIFEKLNTNKVGSIITGDVKANNERYVRLSSSDDLNLNLLTLSFNNNFLKTNSEEVSNIINAYKESCKILNNDLAQVNYLKYFGTEIKFIDKSYVEPNNKFTEEIKLINNWLITNSYIAKEVKEETILESKYLN